MKEVVIAYIAVLLLFAVQFLLSRQKNPWIGLVIPATNAVIGIFSSFSKPEVGMTMNSLIFYFVPASISTAIYLLCKVDMNSHNSDDTEFKSSDEL